MFMLLGHDTLMKAVHTKFRTVYVVLLIGGLWKTVPINNKNVLQWPNLYQRKIK